MIQFQQYDKSRTVMVRIGANEKKPKMVGSRRKLVNYFRLSIHRCIYVYTCLHCIPTKNNLDGLSDS